MKSRITIIICAVLMAFSCFSQEQYLELRAGALGSIIKFKNSGEDTGSQHVRAGGGQISLAFSSQVYKRFHLKTALSIAHSSNHVHLDWETEGREGRVFGDINTNVSTIDILPEYYFGKSKWLFVNLGFGVNRFDYSQSSGWYRYGDNPIDKYKLPNEEDFFVHLIAGIGVKFHYKHIGLMFEMSRTKSNYSHRDTGSVVPGFGMDRVIGNFGISYKLGKSKE